MVRRNKMELKNKILAGLGIGLVGLGGLGAGFVLDTPDTIVEPKLVFVDKDKPILDVEAYKLAVQEGIDSVELPICETCEVCNDTEPEVIEVADEEFITLLCDRDSYDDIKECEEEVKAENEALKLAILEIEDEFADELEDADIVKDEDDVEIVRIYDDFSDINVKESDFDDKEYRFEIRVKVDDDEADEKKYVIFDVEVEDDEASIRKVKEDN